MNYDPGTWTQVSRRYRTVARLPAGLSPEEALRRAMGREPAPCFRGALALDHYLRSFAPPEDRRVLSAVEWEAYLRAGGGSAGTRTATMARRRATPGWRVPTVNVLLVYRALDGSQVEEALPEAEAYARCEYLNANLQPAYVVRPVAEEGL